MTTSSLRSWDRSMLESYVGDELYGFRNETAFHGTITIVAVRAGETYSLHVLKRYDSRREDSRPLTKDDWDQLTSLLNRADFWAMQPEKLSMGLDGEFWTIEGTLGERRQHLHQWCPTDPRWHWIKDAFYSLATTH